MRNINHYQHNKNIIITKENYNYVYEYKKQLLSCITKLLNDINVKFVIGHGNLLEYTRGSPIYHDDDIDIRYNYEDENKLLEYLNQNNYNGLNYNLNIHKGTTMHIRRLTKNSYFFQIHLNKFENKLNINTYNMSINLDLCSNLNRDRTFPGYDINFNNIRKIKLYEIDTYAPSIEDTHKVLSMEYRKYNIPISNFTLD